MKNLMLCAGAIFFFASKGIAATAVEEVAIGGIGTPATVSVSSFTLTKIPASSTLSSRSGILIDNPSTNTGSMVGFLGNCTSTARANTIRPIEIAPSSNGGYISMDNNVCLWIITTLTTGPENVHVQEVSQ